MKILFAASAALLSLAVAQSASAGQTRYDILQTVRIPGDAQEMIARADDVTIRICGDKTKTLYFRSCADDVSAVLKASIPVYKKRAFQAQRKANPAAFGDRSYDLF